jgi:hypothetical protein
MIILSLLLFTVFLVWIIPTYRQRQHIRRWRRMHALDKHEAVFNQLYKNIDGFALSRAARINQDALEYVYGEIEFESFIALLSICKPNNDTIFYDLGSGTGKAVLACSMVFNITYSVGVELFSNLHHCAEERHQCLKMLPNYQQNAQKITFINDNLLSVTLTQSTLVFINATLFLGELWRQISYHLEQLPPQALVISTTKPINSKKFTIEKITIVTMSWGLVNAFIQRRLSQDYLTDNIE